MADIQVINTDADLSGNTLVTEENAYTITGLHTFSRSTNAPFAVVSGAAVVSNLDADELDGQHGSYYLAAANFTGTLAVANGGTGATSLTDGGVLLGSGTGAITALAVLTDGQMIVGDGSGDPVAESGATLRTSIGVGTGDSPTFTGLTVSGTGASALDVGGGLNIGTGNVSLVGTDGKLEGPLSSTIIDDLSGANLTSLNMDSVSSGTLAVARGGTGATTLTEGGVLLGGGTGAITATAVLTDGQMLVGDGSGDPAIESGATLRTSIGVGTTDAPAFSDINIGGGTQGNGKLVVECDASSTAAYIHQDTAGEYNTILKGGNDGATVCLSIQNASGTETATIKNNGNLDCEVLSKASGSFRIPHPHPSKADTHDLVHSFVESNRAGLVYDGEVDLVAGAATIDMDELVGMTSGTWVLLTRDPHVFTSNETGWSPVRGTVSGATLTIECQDNTSTDTVSYMVVAERQDAHMTSADTEWTDDEGRPIIEPLQEVVE